MFMRFLMQILCFFNPLPIYANAVFVIHMESENSGSHIDGIGKSSGTRALHESRYLTGNLQVHPWENLQVRITCTQVPGA